MTDINETGNEGNNPESTNEDVVENDGTVSSTDNDSNNTDKDANEDTTSEYVSKEDFNKIIQKRLAKQEEKVRSEYADYDSLKSTASRVETLEEELSSVQKQYEDALAEKTKLSVLQEYSLPADSLELLHGTTEEEIKESAKKLDSIVSSFRDSASADFTGKQYAGGSIRETDPHLARAKSFFKNN